LIYSSAPEKVAHVYNPEYAPDHVVYTLVLKTCARSKSKKKMDIALYAYECAKEQKIAFTGSMYTGLLRCIAECEDEERRLALTQTVYEEACEAGRITRSVLRQLRWAHPQLYQRHVADNPVNEDDDDHDDDDDDHDDHHHNDEISK
jgi:hypothetical protein